MATSKKTAKPKKASTIKKTIAAKKTVSKKKAVKRPVVKKKIASPVAKKKAVAKTSTSATNNTRALKASIIALKNELGELKNEFKQAKKMDAILDRLADQREAAVERFLSSWDKKALAALEKSLSPKKKTKPRKK